MSEGHIHTAYRWEYDHRAFASLDQHNFTSNTPFCILDVWQCLIRVIVLHLLRRSSNKQSRNFTQDALVSLRNVRTTRLQQTSSPYFANSCTCNLYLSVFLVLISKAELLAFVLPTSLTESIPIRDKHF